MKKQVKRIMKEFCESRKDCRNYLQLDKTYLNICYYLINSYKVKCVDAWDFGCLYDNLIINNEIIDLQNVNEYDANTLEKLAHLKYETIKERLNNNKILLLNYYNKNDLIYCKMWFDLNVNFLDSEILEYLK